MSKSVEKASEKEPDAPQSGSVYDFLYCDSGRIASFLAQFDDAGTLERVIQRESVSKGLKGGYEVSVGGNASIVGTGGGGSLGYKRAPHEQGSEASERVYNPLWANPLVFLDFLTAENLIASDLNKAGIGQFIKVTGSLRIVDFSILKRIFEHPTLKKKLLASIEPPSGNRQERRRKDALSGGLPSDNEVGITLATIFTATTQATMTDEATRKSVWGCLRDDALVVSSADLLLQHGLEIAGQWSMIGVLDAQAGDNKPTVREYGSPFIDGIAGLTPPIREVLGRPNSSFGVTPLLILREISR